MNHINEKTQWSRTCPKCNGVVYHKSKKDRDRAERSGRTCGGKANENCKVISRTQRKKLSVALTGMTYEVRRGPVNTNIPPKWIRTCPNCGKPIEYRGKYHHFQRANRMNTVCNACAKVLSKSRLCDIMAKNPNKIKKMRATKAGFKSWAEYKRLYPKKKQYKAQVWSWTYKNLKRNPPLPNFDKRGRCGVPGAYQIDHIISIHEGFHRNIPPETIGSYDNLQMIPWHQNRQKGK